jgi:hypothetical protein
MSVFRPTRIRTALVCAILVFSLVENAPAQTRLPRTSSKIGRKPAKKTFVSIVLLAGRSGLGIQASRWQPTFNKLNLRIRIRRGTASDKIETREIKVGTIRRVSVTGQLDQTGKLIFSDRSFTLRNSAKFVEWVKELQTYGAQGAPDGKPLWGLSKTQFGEVYSSLSPKVTVDVTGKTLKSAITQMNVVGKLKVRFSADAERWIKTGFTTLPTVQQQIKNHSLGTAMATVLHDYSLGFRPLRSPQGAIELVIVPLSTGKSAWPVGWEPKVLRSKIAPKMYQLIPIELDDVKLVDVLHAISIKTDVPIHIDYAGIRKKRIAIQTLKVSYARQKASWAQLLNGVTIPHKLTRRFRIDERGQPLVWITPLVPGSPRR